MKARKPVTPKKVPLAERDDLVSVVGTNGDEMPRRETSVDVDNEIGPEARVEPDYANQELNESINLDPRARPFPTDFPADISPHGRRNEDEVGLSLKSDQELLDEYESKAAEDRRNKAG